MGTCDFGKYMSVVSVPFRGHSIVLTAVASRAYRRVRRAMRYAGICETDLRMRYVHAFCALRSNGWFRDYTRPGRDGKHMSCRNCVRIMTTFLLHDHNRQLRDGGPLGMITVNLPRHLGDGTAMEYMMTGYESLLCEYPAWRFPKE